MSYDAQIVRDVLAVRRNLLKKDTKEKGQKRKERYLEQFKTGIVYYIQACRALDRLSEHKENGRHIGDGLYLLKKSDLKSLESMSKKDEKTEAIFCTKVQKSLEKLASVCDAVEAWLDGKEPENKSKRVSRNKREQAMFDFMSTLWRPINEGTADYTLDLVLPDLVNFNVTYIKNGRTFVQAF